VAGLPIKLKPRGGAVKWPEEWTKEERDGKERDKWDK
jgi:hypothetical protein